MQDTFLVFWILPQNYLSKILVLLTFSVHIVHTKTNLGKLILRVRQIVQNTKRMNTCFEKAAKILTDNENIHCIQNLQWDFPVVFSISKTPDCSTTDLWQHTCNVFLRQIFWQCFLLPVDIIDDVFSKIFGSP